MPPSSGCNKSVISSNLKMEMAASEKFYKQLRINDKGPLRKRVREEVTSNEALSGGLNGNK
jgi:hypothetical protein